MIEIKFSGTNKADVDGQIMTYLGAAPPAPPPPNTSVYPLTMQPVANFADPVSLGVGPDALVLTLRSYDPVAAPNVLAVLLDGVAVAGPLTVTGSEGKPQIFTLHGSWGPLPHVVQIVPGGAGNQLNNLSVDGVSYDFHPLYYNGPSTDARGGPDMVNAPRVWDNVGASLTFALPVEVAPPPPRNTTILNAQINGVVHTPDTLANLVAATPAGGTLTLPAGTWSGVASLPAAITVAGQGAGTTVIDATGLALARGKAVFVPLVAGSTFQKMTIKGATCPDLNGAAIREDGNGIRWQASNLEISGCQDGVLSFASDIVLTDCRFHDNGAKDAHSHEMYFNGGPTTTVTLNNVTSTAGSGSTHALKSRAGRTFVSGGSYTGNPGAGADDVTGSVLNFPNGGVVSITDTAIIVASNGADPNTLFLSYGTENSLNIPTGNTVTLTRVKVTDLSSTGGVFANGSYTPTARLVIGQGCTYSGTLAPKFQGWASVSGAFTKAVA